MINRIAANIFQKSLKCLKISPEIEEQKYTILYSQCTFCFFMVLIITYIYAQATEMIRKNSGFRIFTCRFFCLIKFVKL